MERNVGCRFSKGRGKLFASKHMRAFAVPQKADKFFLRKILINGNDDVATENYRKINYKPGIGIAINQSDMLFLNAMVKEPRAQSTHIPEKAGSCLLRNLFPLSETKRNSVGIVMRLHFKHMPETFDSREFIQRVRTIGMNHSDHHSPYSSNLRTARNASVGI